MKAHVALLSFTLTATACARTSMSSMPSPELAGRTFHHVLVVAALADLGLRREMELRVASHSSSDNYEFIPSHLVFFPGREYSKEEVASLLHEHHVDATLVIEPGAVGARSGYVPPTYHSGCTLWTSTQGCTQVTTTQTGGYSYNKPWAQFTASLYDANTGAAIWVASATTGGNAYARSGTLVHSMADKTAARLVEDGILK